MWICIGAAVFVWCAVALLTYANMKVASDADDQLERWRAERRGEL